VYPTTASRISVLLLGATVAGVVEETAFRGYMQSHLERVGPTFAILVTSVAFTLIHATHGLTYLLDVAPGFFLASMVLRVPCAEIRFDPSGHGAPLRRRRRLRLLCVRRASGAFLVG